MFLHQTTTIKFFNQYTQKLYIIMFLHQTTTTRIQNIRSNCCILSCSYIKPQLLGAKMGIVLVVYYHVPTSNHNILAYVNMLIVLYIIMFLHQTTTYSIEVVDNQKETIDFSNKKWLCRQYFHANILKKFQLNGFKKSFFLYFASSYILWLPPKIINTSKLFICYTKNTHFSSFW